MGRCLCGSAGWRGSLRPAPPGPRPPPLLLPLLLLLGTPTGRGSDPAENPPQQVTGLLGGAVWFPLKFPPTASVSKILWFLRTGSGPEILIAELKDGKLEWYGTRGTFRQRLEMAGKTTLRIGALEQEDSGLWKAQLIFPTGEVHEQTFRLSVFEPVPDPQIHPQLVSQTAEGCNVTLRCLASGKGAFNISWRRGDQLSFQEDGSGWYQLSAKGPVLHLSWRPSSSNSTLTCLVSNPVDQKNVSLDLLSICPIDSGHPRMTWFLLLAVLLLLLAAGLGIYLWRKRSSRGAVPLTPPEEKKGSPELQYAELKKRSPPKSNENQDPGPLSPCLAEVPVVASPVTVYATLQPPKQHEALPGLGPTSICLPCHSSALA